MVTEGFSNNSLSTIVANRRGISRNIKPNGTLQGNVDGNVAEACSAIAEWRESHFRTLLRHLPYANGDRATMRAQ